MPVWYTSIAAEHQAVRKTAGLFDVGHMGAFAISGPDAAEFLDLVVTGSATRLPVGRAAYTYLLDANGHCLDDLIIYRLAPDRFMAVVNAANAAKDWAWLTGVNDGAYQVVAGDGAARLPVRASLVDLKSSAAGDAARLDLAFQGPKARRVLERIVATDDERRALDAMRMNHVRAFTLAGADVEIAHTGYTGEAIGYEIFVHPEAARTVWDAILEAGAADGIMPVGLGARDSTRTEAGFPLYGHELAGPLDLTPGDAGFGRFAKVYKPFFVGRDPYVRREAARKSAIVRFSIADERVPMARQGDPVTDRRGAWIGTVTSATRVASGRQIGMALRRRRPHPPAQRTAHLCRSIGAASRTAAVTRRARRRKALRPPRHGHGHHAFPRLAETALDQQRIHGGKPSERAAPGAPAVRRAIERAVGTRHGRVGSIGHQCVGVDVAVEMVGQPVAAANERLAAVEGTPI